MTGTSRGPPTVVTGSVRLNMLEWCRVWPSASIRNKDLVAIWWYFCVGRACLPAGCPRWRAGLLSDWLVCLLLLLILTEFWQLPISLLYCQNSKMQTFQTYWTKIPHAKLSVFICYISNFHIFDSTYEDHCATTHILLDQFQSFKLSLFLGPLDSWGDGQRLPDADNGESVRRTIV